MAIEMITPERAGEMLQSNQRNRKLRERRVLRIPQSLLGAAAWPDIEGDDLRFSKQNEAVRG